MARISGRHKIFGVGVNDTTIDTLKGTLRSYVWWKHMITRCYDPYTVNKHPTYADVLVCEEWHKFSNAKKWYDENSIIGWHCDKDLLVAGNKLYCPERCLFVPIWLNSFTTDHKAGRGQYPLGVSVKKNGKFVAQCEHPMKTQKAYIGLFDTAESAHKAWFDRKMAIAMELHNEIESVRKGLFDKVILKIQSLK